ncbi:MAG TPA: zinc ABC transporter substrate-binding protein, partial [Allocoleopsis sp.]
MLTLLTTGCQQTPITKENNPPQTQTKTEKLNIITTILPMYWFTKAIVGNSQDVIILIPPGTEVHEYQGNPGNVQAIAQGDILIKNGLGLEEFLTNTIKNAGNNKLNIVNASEGIKPNKEGNPHVWLDPTLAKKEVENIRDGLIKVNPQNQQIYTTNAQIYIDKLTQLDQEFQQRLKPYKGCTYITLHDAYPYLAQRYNLKQIAVVSIPEDNPLPQDLEKITRIVKKTQVKTLLGEPGFENKLLNSLAKDLKI